MSSLENYGIEVVQGRGAGSGRFLDLEKQHIVEEAEELNLSRSLKQRHVQMIALAGAIVRCFYGAYLSVPAVISAALVLIQF
jgi:amino acid permease